MHLLRRIYSFFFLLCLPAILLRLLWLSRKNPGYRKRLAERLGCVPTQQVPAIWLHAVSVGEVVAAVPLVSALQLRFPHMVVVLTTTTPTGSAEVTRLFGDAVLHYYLPYDLVFFVKRFVRRLSVRVCIIMETEIWPNMLYGLNRLQVPVFLANARLSPRSEKSYAVLGRVMVRLLQSYHTVITQGERDAAAFSRLGLESARLFNGGNMKYDLSLSADEEASGEALRVQLGGRPVWVAASTHAGEEENLLQVHQRLLEKYPAALLILVPRHPDRCEQVGKQVALRGLSMIKHSEKQAVASGDQVYLIDAVGELRKAYVASDVVFMGGSFVPVGGHNFLEPALLKKPLVSGANLDNFIEMRDLLLAADGLTIIKQPSELLTVLLEWFGSDSLREDFGKKAYSIIERNRGAVTRHVERIASVLV